MDKSVEFMENPYIGRDGRDYNSLKALDRANIEWKRTMYPKREAIFYEDKPIRVLR